MASPTRKLCLALALAALLACAGASSRRGDGKKDKNRGYKPPQRPPPLRCSPSVCTGHAIVGIPSEWLLGQTLGRAGSGPNARRHTTVRELPGPRAPCHELGGACSGPLGQRRRGKQAEESAAESRQWPPPPPPVLDASSEFQHALISPPLPPRPLMRRLCAPALLVHRGRHPDGLWPKRDGGHLRGSRPAMQSAAHGARRHDSVGPERHGRLRG